jgi:hypothetical protein
MLIAREFVAYLSRQVAKRLTPTYVETSNPQALTELTTTLILDELEVEDRLNDEVRDILGQYSDYMRQEGVSYQEMFRRIKNTLITQRKITDISHTLVTALRKNRELRVKKDPNDVRLEIVRAITDLLAIEEKVDRASRDKVRSQKREIPEGSEEWDILQKRYYAEELKKFGIDLAR